MEEHWFDGPTWQPPSDFSNQVLVSEVVEIATRAVIHRVQAALDREPRGQAATFEQGSRTPASFSRRRMYQNLRF
jgi:hypothetical protein